MIIGGGLHELVHPYMAQKLRLRTQVWAQAPKPSSFADLCEIHLCNLIMNVPVKHFVFVILLFVLALCLVLDPNNFYHLNITSDLPSPQQMRKTFKTGWNKQTSDGTLTQIFNETGTDKL